MRYRIEVERDLNQARRAVEQNRRTADRTDKRQTAGICDAVLPSLERRVVELEAEMTTAVDRPPSNFAYGGIQHEVYSRKYFDDKPSLEIPSFLRRRK